MSVDYCLVVNKKDAEIDGQGLWIGSEHEDHCRILSAYEWEEITDNFIERISRAIDSMGTTEEHQLKEIVTWLNKNTGKKYFIETD